MIPVLLRARRFLPLFVVQATGGLNDNLFKNALIILLVFRSVEGGAGGGGAGLAAAAGGVFIAPYALFSAVAGQVADRFDKAALIRANKACELVLMVFGAWALVSGGAAGLLAVLFGLGVQATAFGPLKYGILPQHLAAGELLDGNALIEAATFAAILVGTILGGVLIGGAEGPLVVGVLGVALSAVGLGAALFVSPAPGSAAVAVRWNLVAAAWTVLRAARREPSVWRAVLGLSWFWAVGATYLAVFPVLVRDVFHAGTAVVTLLLSGFALGVGVGALLGARLAHGRATGRLVAGRLVAGRLVAGRLVAGRLVAGRLVAPAGVALSLCTFGFAGLCASPAAGGWGSPVAMLRDPAGLAAWLALFGAAVAGGVFSLPLNTAIQQGAAPSERSRMVAANNVMNAVFMVVGAGVIAGVSAAGVSPGLLLAGVGLANLGVAWWFGRGQGYGIR